MNICASISVTQVLFSRISTILFSGHKLTRREHYGIHAMSLFSLFLDKADARL